MPEIAAKMRWTCCFGFAWVVSGERRVTCVLTSLGHLIFRAVCLCTNFSVETADLCAICGHKQVKDWTICRCEIAIKSKADVELSADWIA